MNTFVKNIIDSIFFFMYFVVKENFINYLKNIKNQKLFKNKIVHVLANGPSLKQSLEKMKESWEVLKEDEFCGVNYIANEPLFMRMKPKFYALSDPQFFTNTHIKSKDGKALVDRLNEVVDWEMYMLIPYAYKKYTSLFTNKNIKIVLIHSRRYIGFEKMRFWYYRHGFGNGEFGTVVQHAIYAMVTIGFKQIKLYGVDHNYFNGLTVQDDNKLYYRYQHSFDTEEPKLTPIIFGSETNITVSKFLTDFGYLFSGHEILNRYAISEGCEIINCTPGSFIDAYKRGS